VCSTISSEVADPANRLFAVIYVNGRQFKVSQNDLIALRGSLPLAAGERIKLEKVLMVGSSNFSVFGRPLLNSVTVEATVVEKTTTYPELRYDRNNHRHIKAIHWLSEEMTVLRINEISAKDLMKEPSS
ncbi:ribosomal protein L21, partial [Oesophagostomum dentatum]